MTRLVSNEGFSLFARLMQVMAPHSVGLALCDAGGQPIHAVKFKSGVQLVPALRHLHESKFGWASQQQLQLHEEPSKEYSLLTTGIVDMHKSPIAALAIMVPKNEDHAVSARALRRLADCVQHEIGMETELASMTQELTERYEELNLVYHTEDQVKFFREGREALQSLTQNCLDYLDVNLAMLVLKEKGVRISCNNRSAPIPDEDNVIAQLSSGLYSWIQENARTVVINDSSEPLASELLPDLSYRVLCCPILDTKGEVSGILATVNNLSKATFANSNRNLLQVMARKASKILAANYDSLTGLINRSGYEYFLSAALEDVKTSEAEHCLLHINIDQLHVINDTLSHAAGDAAIRSVAAILETQKRDIDTLSRHGGDEFGLLLQNCQVMDGSLIAERICKTVEQSPIDYDGETYKVTVSIGIAEIDPSYENVAQVLGVGELACSVAKEQGRNRVEMYRPENTAMMRRGKEMQMVARIQSALDDDRMTLYCQPIQALKPGDKKHHTEILTRLIDEKGKICEPATFVPAAERYQLMPSIDRWVVSQTLQMLADKDDEQLRNGTFAINLSGQSLGEEGFLDYIHAELKRSGIPPENICFEITETAAVANMRKAVRFMASLKRVGCSFSLDDFGAGISSFGYLKSLPVDFLKIDGSLVKDIVTDKTSHAMVDAINKVGHTMNLLTIAEFVEDEAIKSCLIDVGVDYIQGFNIGRPEPFADRLDSLTAKTAAAS